MTVSEVSVDLLQPEFYELAATWLSNPDINCWLYSEWRNRSVDGRMVALVAANTRNRLFLACAANRPVGIVALGEINEIDRSASIWYLLGDQESNGRGITRRAVGLASDYAFGELALHTLYASVMDGNISSCRILEKNNFCEVGRFRDAFCVDGKFVDRIAFDRVSP